MKINLLYSYLHVISNNTTTKSVKYKNHEKTIAKHDMENQTHQKVHRNSPLTDEQKAKNTEKSKTRSRIEHVFGFMEEGMNRLRLKSLDIKRTIGIIG